MLVNDRCGAGSKLSEVQYFRHYGNATTEKICKKNTYFFNKKSNIIKNLKFSQLMTSVVC